MATTKGIFGLETKVKEKKIKESKSEIINLADYLIGKKKRLERKKNIYI